MPCDKCEPNFDTRIVCKEEDVEEVLSVLSHAVVAGAVRKYPAREPGHVRLYFRARVRAADLTCDLEEATAD
jgi:hypothetical protein